MPWYGWVSMFCFYTACQTVTTVSIVMSVRGRKVIGGQARTSSGRFASQVREAR